MFLHPSWLAFAMLAPAACAPAEGSAPAAPSTPRVAPAVDPAPALPPAQDSLQPVAPAPAAGPCNVRVRFGSYGPGIDTEALGAIRSALADDPRVRSIAEGPPGREGELDLCVTVRSAADAGPVARRLIGALPPQPRPGPVEVMTDAGRIHPAERAR